jgi:hypothetical protein
LNYSVKSLACNRDLSQQLLADAVVGLQSHHWLLLRRHLCLVVNMFLLFGIRERCFIKFEFFLSVGAALIVGLDQLQDLILSYHFLRRLRDSCV